MEHQNEFSKPWNCYDSLRLCKDTQGQWSPVKMSDWMLHLIPRGKGSMRVQQETAFFTDTRLRRNWVSLWAVFDSWAVGTAHTGFVGTLWRIGEAEPKINSLVLDCDLLTSKWSHKIAHRHCTLPGLFKNCWVHKGNAITFLFARIGRRNHEVLHSYCDWRKGRRKKWPWTKKAALNKHFSCWVMADSILSLCPYH